MRPVRQERTGTALAGREAANLREGVSKVVHRRLPRQQRPLRGVALRNTSCVSPFGPSLRNVQKRSQRFCARLILGACPDGTCLRQSKKAPSVFVCMPSLACIINNNPIVIHPNNLKVIHYSLVLSINPACFFSLIR